MKDNNTAMALCPDLMDAVRTGTKKVTIRKGYRNIRLGHASFLRSDIAKSDEVGKIQRADLPNREIKIIVTSVLHCQLMKVPIEDLKRDGFEDLSHTVQEMKAYYPDITPETEVTVINFRLPWKNEDSQ